VDTNPDKTNQTKPVYTKLSDLETWADYQRRQKTTQVVPQPSEKTPEGSNSESGTGNHKGERKRSYADIVRDGAKPLGKPKGGANEEFDVDEEPLTEIDLKSELAHHSILLQDAIDESALGACVSTSNMDYLAERVWQIAEGNVDKRLEGKLLSAQAEKLGNVSGAKWVIQPMIHNAHYVFVAWDHAQKDTATVWDSVRNHKPTERDAKIRRLYNVKHVNVVNNGPQKLNDCCFHTIHAMCMFLSEATKTKVEHARTRADCMKIVDTRQCGDETMKDSLRPT